MNIPIRIIPIVTEFCPLPFAMQLVKEILRISCLPMLGYALAKLHNYQRQHRPSIQHAFRLPFGSSVVPYPYQPQHNVPFLLLFLPTFDIFLTLKFSSFCEICLKIFNSTLTIIRLTSHCRLQLLYPPFAIATIRLLMEKFNKVWKCIVVITKWFEFFTIFVMK